MLAFSSLDSFSIILLAHSAFVFLTYVLWSFYLIADFLRRISRFFQTSAETVAVAAVRR